MIASVDWAGRAWLAAGASAGAAFSCWSMWWVVDAGAYLSYAATRGAPVDGWLGLSISEVLLAISGVVGMWSALAKRMPIAFVAFCALQLPLPILVASMRF